MPVLFTCDFTLSSFLLDGIVIYFVVSLVIFFYVINLPADFPSGNNNETPRCALCPNSYQLSLDPNPMSDQIICRLERIL